ncbi:ATP-dependent protease La [Batrachochytrium dendrobatidis JEL423]|nr:ATP-dependent protease La [Batrachochytrium dendrobatidis JEL423]
MTAITIPDSLPLIPTRNSRVLLPGIVVRLQIGRKDSTQLLDSLYSKFHAKEILVIGCVPLLKEFNNNNTASSSKSFSGQSQTHRVFDPEGTSDTSNQIIQGDLFGWGCAARIVEFSNTGYQEKRTSNINYLITLEGPPFLYALDSLFIDGLTVIAQLTWIAYFEILTGIARFKIKEITQTLPFLVASVQLFTEPEAGKDDMELHALVLSLRKTGNDLSQALSQLQLPPTVLAQLKDMLQSTPPGQLADLFTSMIDLTLDEKLEILEMVDLKPRLTKVILLLNRQLQVLKISQKLQSTVQNRLGQKQREFLLREQLEAIKKELGENDDGKDADDVVDLTKRIAESKLPEEPLRAAQRELKRLSRMNPNMSEYQVIRTYLEWMAELPWSQKTPDNLDISHARGILDHDHHGLDRVKLRVIEYLAVRKLKQDLRGPILCLVGPPGVGKTSLGKSIANALGRKFHRISLGGIHDEAEIRGHRRTYLGSLPGLIVQGLRQCGVNNPVLLLDEIDKLGHDYRGDPSSALLEVLDPEQNSTFTDHYLGVPFNLSNVLFIATANDMDTIPAPLLDRMEVVQISGYTVDEKLSIARQYLLPKQIHAHGLAEDHVKINDTLLLKIATGYTREAGVRHLEREIAAVCRSLAVEYSILKETGREAVFNGIMAAEKLESILGVERFDDEVSERTGVPGIVTGLAWTSTGSGGLLFIESTCTPGSGKLHLTGKLGDVIKESAQIGVTWVRANADALGIHGTHKNLFEDTDIHVHFPSGAISKDGPSAGVSIVTSLVSLLTKSVVRNHTAMTGEITLRGQVLPVGGIKEKILAAHRGGIKQVIVPYRNQKDVISDIPDRVKREMQFVYAKSIWDVLGAAFPEQVQYEQQRIAEAKL